MKIERRWGRYWHPFRTPYSASLRPWPVPQPTLSAR